MGIIEYIHNSLCHRRLNKVNVRLAELDEAISYNSGLHIPGKPNVMERWQVVEISKWKIERAGLLELKKQLEKKLNIK